MPSYLPAPKRSTRMASSPAIVTSWTWRTQGDFVCSERENSWFCCKAQERRDGGNLLLRSGMRRQGAIVAAYEWGGFIQVLGVMVFLLVHGISVGVSLRLRKERDPQRVRALLELSLASVGGTHMF